MNYSMACGMMRRPKLEVGFSLIGQGGVSHTSILGSKRPRLRVLKRSYILIARKPNKLFGENTMLLHHQSLLIRAHPPKQNHVCCPVAESQSGIEGNLAQLRRRLPLTLDRDAVKPSKSTFQLVRVCRMSSNPTWDRPAR